MVMLIPFGCIEDIKDLLGRDVDRLRTNLVIEHSVLDADVGKGSSGHDEIIASSSAVCVEILLLDALLFEEAGCWRCPSNVSCRRNVIGSDRITKNCQNVGIFNGFNLGQLSFY